MSKADPKKPAPSREPRARPSRPRVIGANDNQSKPANDTLPVVILLGDLPVLSRNPIDRLSPGETARINRIEAAQRGRKHREASKLALEYEASQDITMDERIAAMSPVTELDRAIEHALGYAVKRYGETYEPPAPPKREKKAKGKKKPKAKATPAEDFPVGDLRQDEIDAVEVAETKLKSTDLALKKEGAATMARIRDAVTKRVRKQVVEDGLAENMRLEALRGAKVMKSPRPSDMGGYLVSGRDGLETLSAEKTDADGKTIKPALSPRLFAACLRYRADYEQIDPERLLTPPALDRGAASSHGGEGWDEKKREIEERIWAVHLRIAGVDKPDAGRRSAMPNLPEGHPIRRAVYALNEIAGKGRNPSEMTASGGTRNRLVASLVFAAQCAAIVYGLPEPDTTS